jgi:4-diphosphocytidyl-2-C-methyl-D-erythritol kinase
LVIFSNCKINLGLQIISKRADGYHNLETVFYPVPVFDIIEIITAAVFQFSVSGLVVDAASENNLCVQAYHLLKKDFQQIPPVQMHLHKAIPMGAGLGGGSANAACTLQLLNRKYLLGISSETLKKYALQLGSDCAFFIENKPCRASGRGELLNPISLDLSGYTIILLFPPITISTASAFGNIIPRAASGSLTEIIKEPVSCWKETLYNDFENPVFALHPQLRELKEKLYKAGAVYASLTGSGSVLYGLFDLQQTEKELLKKRFAFIPNRILYSEPN